VRDGGIGVAEERERQAERLGKGLLRKRIVHTNAQNLNVEILERLEVDHPGGQIFRARDGEINAVKLQQHRLFAAELTEADGVPRGTGERKVWCGLIHRERLRMPRHEQPVHEERAHQQIPHALFYHIVFPPFLGRALVQSDGDR
jgi:hypothetical protein